VRVQSERSNRVTFASVEAIPALRSSQSTTTTTTTTTTHAKTMSTAAAAAMWAATLTILWFMLLGRRQASSENLEAVTHFRQLVDVSAVSICLQASSQQPAVPDMNNDFPITIPSIHLCLILILIPSRSSTEHYLANCERMRNTRETFV
jgi:hypothetical protein